MYLNWNVSEMTVTQNELTIESEFLKRDVTITLLLPDGREAAEPMSLLLLNDGQETTALQLSETLENLYESGALKPVAVAAIHCGNDRLQEYGIAGKPDYKQRGAKARVYTKFITEELLPAIKKETGIDDFEATAFAGFSLGGLSAMDIAWNNAALFDKVGVFSGSFWWRSKELGKGYTDADRIMHQSIRDSKGKRALKFWLQTGTKDEAADRNKNGIIDSIDDTIDVIKELEAKGYTRPADIQYLEIVGGTHSVATWALAMPKFLVWAFGR
ncbi:alpha/beta hydrolase [Mucilaginibacter ginsenosidivorans]|uniref:Esterase family protein n=1 Tax=Mucilaginibacter ginsenosidivorans TaxID=398053 RepID=A0A5B8UQP3_9SPHI|nr:alpha/beta hydrolase-fold protein [Mucilaginibacter ginsenosidivorans]QEC61148.1 esterase family protein [Mucilaginibacter ginsenosidivorans]